MQICDALDAVLPAAVYDAVTLWHSLEHLDDPLAALRHLRPALRPGGILLVEVPNAAGWAARGSGAYWLHLDLPRHRFHFTPASLRLLLKKAGFEGATIEPIPNPHGLAGALAYRWGRRWRWSAASLALGWLIGLTAALARRADVMRATTVHHQTPLRPLISAG